MDHTINNFTKLKFCKYSFLHTKSKPNVKLKCEKRNIHKHTSSKW